MPEEQEITMLSAEEPSAAGEYSVADALKEREEELRAEREPSPEPPAEEETETDEPKDEGEPEGEETDEAPEGEPEDDDVPELADIILDPDADPVAKKQAWANHWKGIIKREQRVAAVEEQLNALGTGSVEESRKVFLDAANRIAEARGITVQEYLGLTPQETVEDGVWPDGFASEKEVEHETRLERIERLLAEAEKDRAEQKRQAELDALVDRIAPRTIKKTAENLHGFKVDKNMIREAVLAFPNEKDPVEAVGKRYWKEIAAHSVKMSRERTGTKGPELLPKSGARGHIVKQPEEYSVMDALEELKASRT